MAAVDYVEPWRTLIPALKFHGRLDHVPWLAALLSPDRWLLWLGLLFVLSVYHFPTGVVGRLRLGAALRALKSGRA